MSGLELRAVREAIERAEDAGVPVPPEVTAALHKLEGCGSTYAAGKWAEDHPDDDMDGCCFGVAVYGPDRCTCWEPRYDGQTQLVPDLTAEVGAARDSKCGDCAFRKDSPELTVEYTRETLLSLAVRGDPTVPVTRATIASGEASPFWCHQGMRRPTHFEHVSDLTGKPTGRRVEGSTDDWQPPMLNGVPYRLDGQPGLLCAGYVRQREAEAKRRG